ncbi:MAG: replicative DNA helicase [Proteobacteria bacterium]|nr:replicative DNA helicase [Pseudomonadota bacterium]
MALQKNDTDSFLNKLPPQNIEAEESILSAILINNDVLLDVVEILLPEHFYKASHQIIYSAITDLFTKSEPVDLITLAHHLKNQDKLTDIGGAAYLSRLVDTVPLSVNPVFYSKIIREKSALRKLIQNASRIVTRCFEDRGDVDDIIDFAEKTIFEITEDKLQPSFAQLKHLIDKNIDLLEERQGSDNQFTGFPTGFRQIDHITSGLQRSDLIIIAARPSMGKTAFALNIARNMAIESRIPVAVFSLEMSKEQLSMRLLTSEARVDSHRLKSGFLSSDDWSKITNSAGILAEAPIYIDDSADVSPMDIRAKARRLSMNVNGLGLIIIDYLQLMKGRSTIDRHLEIAEISRSLKSLAKELNIPIIALSQLNRMLEQRSDKRPVLSDLRESGALEQDADIVAFIYRDEVYNKEDTNPNKGKAEIIIAKHRNGATGAVPLTFIGKYTRFENPAPSEFDQVITS